MLGTEAVPKRKGRLAMRVNAPEHCIPTSIAVENALLEYHHALRLMGMSTRPIGCASEVYTNFPLGL